MPDPPSGQTATVVLDSDPLDIAAAATRVLGAACRLCGADNPDDARYCGRCAAPLRMVDDDAWRDPLLGALVGERYRVLARIGAGGMGAVYRVEHISIGRVFAMKLLHGDLTRNPSMVRRFQREARAVSRLSNPHTVSVFDHGRSDGLVYLVMEYLQGRDLAEILAESGPLTPARVAMVIGQVAASLAEAHAAGIVHRDIKPHNLFVCEGDGVPTIKVVDFGLARSMGASDGSAALTGTGAVLGTPYYMAPEQIEDEPVDARTDIYALAAVAWHLLTGAPVFSGSSMVGILQRHLAEPPPSLAAVDPAWAPLDPVLHRALAKRPGDRYADVTEFAAAFASAVAVMSRPGAPELGELVSPAERKIDRAGTREEFEQFERSLRMRHALRIAAAASVGVAAVAAGIWLSARAGAAPTMEREPNDATSSAVHLGTGGVVRGFIEQSDAESGDRDVYLVDAAGPARPVLVAEVSGVPGVDLVLEVVDGRGVVLARSDNQGEGGGEYLPNVRPNDAAAWIVVRPLFEQGVAPRHNELSPYALSVRQRSAYLGEESEPNDVVAESGRLIVGQSAVGLLGTAGDRDVWAFAPGPVSTEVSVSGIAGVDLAIELLDEWGGRIARVDAAGPGQSELVRIGGVGVYADARFVAVEHRSGPPSHLVYVVEARVPETNTR